MGPPGSVSLTLLGAGLLLLAFYRRGPAPYFGLVVCLITVVPAIGFLYGITAFYDQFSAYRAGLTVPPSYLCGV